MTGGSHRAGGNPTTNGSKVHMVGLADIEAAREVIAPHLRVTPALGSARLSERIGANLVHKAELFQKTGSFKPRGALNRLHQMERAELDRGLIAVSGGNHAQGLAFAAGRVGAPCLIVMPENVPGTKVAATRSYGADVVLHGDVNAAYEKMDELREERGLTLVHPFDDPFVVAGQGTVGLEILEQVPDVTVVVVPVGGGGLISGVATALKEARGDAVRVIGVEPLGADPMCASREQGYPVRLPSVDDFALSLAAPLVSDLTFAISSAHVDDVVTVTRDEMVDGLEAVMTSAKLYAELGGAASTAALLSGKISVSADDVVAAVVSGGNMGWDELGELTTRHYASTWEG